MLTPEEQRQEIDAVNKNALLILDLVEVQAVRDDVLRSLIRDLVRVSRYSVIEFEDCEGFFNICGFIVDALKQNTAERQGFNSLCGYYMELFHMLNTDEDELNYIPIEDRP